MIKENKIVIILAIIGLIVVWTTVDNILERWIGLSSIQVFMIVVIIVIIVGVILDGISKLKRK